MWNAFIDKPTSEEERYNPAPGGVYYGGRISTTPTFMPTALSALSILGPAFNRIAIDVSTTKIRHMKKDNDGYFSDEVDSGLNNILSVAANIDQSGTAFIQNVVEVMLDRGIVALIPTHTRGNPLHGNSYDIMQMRVGTINQWYPDSVEVEAYNSMTDRMEVVTLPKSAVAIIHNPLYTTINRENASLKRLIRKVQLLDRQDERTASGKLDIIVQLPFAIRSDKKKEEAEARRTQIESQLANSSHGIAYIDGNERVIQLNRAAENTLREQIKELQEEVLAQIGFTTEILNGTADQTQNLNYFNRILTPMLAAIVEGIDRTFITKTARTQGQAIRYTRSPFKDVSPKDLAEMIDKLRRGEILTSNEVREVFGYSPSKEPSATTLRNPNIAQREEVSMTPTDYTVDEPGDGTEDTGGYFTYA